MTKRITIISALVCAVFAVALGGCGGDDDTSSTTAASGASGATGASGAPLTKDEFIKQADAICAAGNDTLDAAGQALGQNPTDEQLTQAINETVIPTTENEFDQIEALTPPEGDEDEVAAIIAAGRSGLDEIKDNPDRAFAAGQDSPFAEVNRLAQDYGFEVCGSDNS